MAEQNVLDVPGKTKEEVIIDKYHKLKGDRSNFESYWQSLHDYFYIEAADINRSYSIGNELDSTFLWDSTTLEASDVLASGFMNYLTPPSSKWFKLRAKDKGLADNHAAQAWFEEVGEEVDYALNRSNFYNQVIGSYKSSGVFGTSIMLEEEDIEDDIRFFNLPIKQVCINEDACQRVTEYYIEFEYTTYQAASRWGAEKLSKEMQEEIKTGDLNKKHNFILFIGNRSIRNVSKSNKENLPIQALWVDVKGKKVVDEGGYNEFPAMCHRFDKRAFIPWGFSPAMKSLPFARILNAIAKTNLRTMMKATDPAIAVPNNAFIMPFNMNPRAVNYYNKKVMDSGKDIFAFGNMGNPEVGLNALEYYSQKVKTLMYNDVFLAFNNLTKQMNNPEVMERINEKMTMLGPAVGRYTSEVLDPIVIRTIGILWRRGKLPQPPDELINDPSYEIDYVSRLAQAQKGSELNALSNGITAVGNMAQFNPEVLDKINPDKTVDEIWEITGAPVHILRSDDEVEAIRTGRAKQQEAMNKMAMLQAGAQAGKDASQADANIAKAKQPNTK